MTFDQYQNMVTPSDLPSWFGSRYCQLQEVASVCLTAKRLVERLHQAHQSTLPFHLYNNQTVFANTENDIFLLEVLVRAYENYPGDVACVRQALVIEDHFGDLFRIPPLVLPGSNLLIGVRQLAFRLWAYEQDEGPEPGETQCRDWRCVQVSYEEEFATISLKGGPAVYWWDSNSNDYEATVCYSCS